MGAGEGAGSKGMELVARGGMCEQEEREGSKGRELGARGGRWEQVQIHFSWRMYMILAHEYLKLGYHIIQICKFV
jgi:hypothetical protein